MVVRGPLLETVLDNVRTAQSTTADARATIRVAQVSRRQAARSRTRSRDLVRKVRMNRASDGEVPVRPDRDAAVD
jgi:hypothetical protein